VCVCRPFIDPEGAIRHQLTHPYYYICTMWGEGAKDRTPLPNHPAPIFLGGERIDRGRTGSQRKERLPYIIVRES